jgi:hypothetical protein
VIPRIPVGVLLAVVLAAGTLVAAQREPPPASVDLVDLDVVVVDRKGQPVTGLTQADFTVKEDGKPIQLQTFSEVSPDGDADERRRSIILLLDDAGVSSAGTRSIQTIANAFVESAAPMDEVSVIRLHSRTDEPFGDRRVAGFRIAEYQAGSQPFADWSTPQEALQRITTLSQSIDSGDRRTIIVCIGATVVCNIVEPPPIAPFELWPRWVETLSATARANVAVYAVVPGRAGIRGGGLVEFTGGELFATTYDIAPALNRILQDASYHYLLGYWPPEGKRRELHSIDVKVARRGLKVLARRQRGG